MKTHLQQSIERHRIAPSCEAFHDVDALIPDLEKHLASIECLEEAVANQRANDTVRASMEAYDVFAKPNETKPSQIKAALKRAWKWVLELLAKIRAAFIRGFDWLIEKSQAIWRQVRKYFEEVIHGEFHPVELKLSDDEAAWAPDLKVLRFDSKFYKTISASTKSISAMFSDVKVLGFTVAEASHEAAITQARIGKSLQRAIHQVWDGQEVPGNGQLPECYKFQEVLLRVDQGPDIFKDVAGLVALLKVEHIQEGEVKAGPRSIHLESAAKARTFMSKVEDYAEALHKAAGECRRDVSSAIESLSSRISTFASGEADVDHSKNPARYGVEILQHLQSAAAKVASIDYRYLAILVNISGRITRGQARAPGTAAPAAAAA